MAPPRWFLALRQNLGTFVVPKHVALHDWRLGALWRVLQLAVAAFMLQQALSAKSYLATERPLGGASLYIERGGGEYERAVEEAFKGAVSGSASAMCTEAGAANFAFQWSPDWRYSPTGCWWPRLDETYEKRQLDVFFTTSANRRTYHVLDAPRIAATRQECADAFAAAIAAGGVDAPQECGAADVGALAGSVTVAWEPVDPSRSAIGRCSCVVDTLRLVPGVEALRVGIDHSFVSRFAADVLPETIVKHHKSGRVLARIPAGKTLALGIGEMLEWADIDLDAPVNVGGNANTLELSSMCSSTCNATKAEGRPAAGDGVCDDGGPDAATSLCAFGTDCVDCGRRRGLNGGLQGPLGMRAGAFPRIRISGLRLVLSLKYYNHKLQNEGGEFVSDDKEVCIATVVPHLQWTSLGDEFGKKAPGESDLPSPGDGISLYRYGIDFRIELGGSVGRFNVLRTIDVFTSALVLIFATGVVVKAVAQFGLGERSALYRKQLEEPVAFRQQYARYALQAIVGAYVFDRLDTDLNGTLSREEIMGRLESFMSDVGLDVNRVGTLASFIFNQVSRKRRSRRLSTRDATRRDWREDFLPAEEDEDPYEDTTETITRRDFIEIFSGSNSCDTVGLRRVLDEYEHPTKYMLQTQLASFIDYVKRPSFAEGSSVGAAGLTRRRSSGRDAQVTHRQTINPLASAAGCDPGSNDENDEGGTAGANL